MPSKRIDVCDLSGDLITCWFLQGIKHSKPSTRTVTLADVLHCVPGIVRRVEKEDCMSLLRTARGVRNAVLRQRPATLEVTVNSLRALERRATQLGNLTVTCQGISVPVGDASRLLRALEGCNYNNTTSTPSGSPADHVRAVRSLLESSIRDSSTPLHLVGLHINAPLPEVNAPRNLASAQLSELMNEVAALRQVVRLTEKADVLRMTSALRAHHGTLEELDVTGAANLNSDYLLPAPAVVSAWGDLWRWIGRARNLRVLRLAQSDMTPNFVDNPSFQKRMVDALLACEQLEVLELQCDVLREAVIDRIMPRLVTLRELRLRSCGINAAIAQMMATGLAEARGGALQVLDLSNAFGLGAGFWCWNEFNLAAALPSLARLLQCGRLEDLHMSCVGLTDGGASSLAEAIEDESCKLRVLDVSFNKLREEVAALGAAIGASRTLEVVNLDGNLIDDEGMSAIGRGLRLSKTIRELSLCGRSSDTLSGPWTEGARSLGGGLRRTRSLRVLRVDYYSFQPADYAAILDGLAANSSVEVMSMFSRVGNRVDYRVARKVADMLRRNRTLRDLNMQWKNVTKRGLAAIGRALRSGNETLQYLSADRDEDGRCALRQLAVENSKVVASESRSPPSRWGAVGIVSLYVLAFFAFGRVEKDKDTPAPVKTFSLVTAATAAGMVGIDAGLTFLEGSVIIAMIRGLMTGNNGPAGRATR
ncbi:unnamed protein product [Pedinophyceae sp. YPF-701]|nr:unnamed protein product [Pedinophyceae sp. YPF-701]